MAVVDRAVQVIRGGGRIAVSCLSGRGRSGTFSALVVGKLKQLRSHSELVDSIVTMREYRDGIVETPQQFRFVARMLGMPSTADCGMVCSVQKGLHQHESYRLLTALIAGALLVLVPVIFMLRKARI
jgi:hypothetical protein